LPSNDVIVDRVQFDNDVNAKQHFYVNNNDNEQQSYVNNNDEQTSYVNDNNEAHSSTYVALSLPMITFRVSHRRREMYIGHVRLCVSVCVSVCASPYAHTTARNQI